MPDESSPSKPLNPPSANSVSEEAPAAPAVVGHIPMSDEFHRTRRTLPVVPMLMGVLVVAIVVAIYMFTVRPKIITNSAISQVRAVAQGDNILVAVQVKFDNSTDRQLWVTEVTSELETADGKKYTDQAAPRVDLDRYMRAFPQLAEANAAPLGAEQKISPGPYSGVSVFAFPVDKATFDGRKSLGLRIKFYEWPALELKQ